MYPPFPRGKQITPFFASNKPALDVFMYDPRLNGKKLRLIFNLDESYA